MYIFTFLPIKHIELNQTENVKRTRLFNERLTERTERLQKQHDVWGDYYWFEQILPLLRAESTMIMQWHVSSALGCCALSCSYVKHTVTMKAFTKPNILPKSHNYSRIHYVHVWPCMSVHHSEGIAPSTISLQETDWCDWQIISACK